MSAKYYHSELAYLREMGREFAAVHPGTAGLLAERGGDPDVERLLEGFAFLTGRLRERLDAAMPSIVDGLAEFLIPHYLRPVPAASLVQFQPSLAATRGVQCIPRGSLVSSQPVGGTSCLFRTCSDVDILPLEIAGAELDDSRSARPSVNLRLQTTEAGQNLLAQPGGLRIQLHGEAAHVATLFLWFLRHCVGITVRAAEDRTRTVRLDPSSLVPCGFEADDALLPWPEAGLDGYRLLQEFLCLPDKFLAFRIMGLQAVAVESNDVEISFEFDRPPPLPHRIEADNFRLHCTPVINLFEVGATPIKLDPLVHEHIVRPLGLRHDHAEVFSVESVAGFSAGEPARPYRSFYSFTHGLGGPGPTSSYYALRRARSPLDGCLDLYLAIQSPRDVTPRSVPETLSVELLCTNRQLPSELRLGDISVPARGAPNVPPFKNIVAVTNPARPPVGSELQWRLLAHLAINRSSLSRPEALRTLMSLYNFQLTTSPQRGRANERKIDAIRAVESTGVTRLVQGAPVRGTRTTVELDESKTEGVGEAFLFGSILDQFLAEHASINSFNEFAMRLHPSKETLRWPAKTGQRSAI